MQVIKTLAAQRGRTSNKTGASHNNVVHSAQYATPEGWTLDNQLGFWHATPPAGSGLKGKSFIKGGFNAAKAWLEAQ